jgi:hypothetical protein
MPGQLCALFAQRWSVRRLAHVAHLGVLRAGPPPVQTARLQQGEDGAAQLSKKSRFVAQAKRCARTAVASMLLAWAQAEVTNPIHRFRWRLP